MKHFSGPLWGYRIISDTVFSFYHLLLSKTQIDVDLFRLARVKELVIRDDGSLLITTFSAADTFLAKEELSAYFWEREKEYLETPNYYFSIEKKVQSAMLYQWALVFEGSLAILLILAKENSVLLGKEWEFIDSKIGGLYIKPFTLIFNKDYVKVIHPISVQNYDKRDMIERMSSLHIKEMVERVRQAALDQEGAAMIAYVVEKTGLLSREVAYLISKKAQTVSSNPCLFFNPS